MPTTGLPDQKSLTRQRVLSPESVALFRMVGAGLVAGMPAGSLAAFPVPSDASPCEGDLRPGGDVPGGHRKRCSPARRPNADVLAVAAGDQANAPLAGSGGVVRGPHP